MTATRKATDYNRESTSQMFDFHLPLLGENREAKDRWSKEILSTVKLNTRLTSIRPNPQKVHELTVINFHGIYILLLFSLALSSLKYPKIFLHKQFCTAAEPEAPLRRLVRSKSAFSSYISKRVFAVVTIFKVKVKKRKQDDKNFNQEETGKERNEESR
uniref:Uncharacterized protein n=1 Tax=Solanum lycopersicum TaxID=4081 RepID=A0A3Q7FW10_SOLLC